MFYNYKRFAHNGRFAHHIAAWMLSPAPRHRDREAQAMFATFFAVLSIAAITYMLLYRQDKTVLFMGVSFLLCFLSMVIGLDSPIYALYFVLAVGLVVGILVAGREFSFRISWVPFFFARADTRSLTAMMLIFGAAVGGMFNAFVIATAGAAVALYILRDKDKESDDNPVEPIAQEDHS